MTNTEEHAKYLADNDMVAVGPIEMLASDSESDYRDNGDGTAWMYTGRIAQLCRAATA